VFYKAVSAYWGVAAGRFTYEVRPAGTDPTAPAEGELSGRQLQPDRSYTAAVVGPKANLRGILLADDKYQDLKPGKYRVQALQAGTGRTVATGSLTLRPGTVTTAILTGGAGQPNEVFAVKDGTGMAYILTTAHGVATGAGGTAEQASGPRSATPLAPAPWPQRPPGSWSSG
jgi:hypothetical protein